MLEIVLLIEYVGAGRGKLELLGNGLFCWKCWKRVERFILDFESYIWGVEDCNGCGDFGM